MERRGMKKVVALTALTVAAAAASCAGDSEKTQGAALSVVAAAPVDAVAARVADLRERFQLAPAARPLHARRGMPAPTPRAVIPQGVGARFVARASGRVDVVVPAAAKRAVLRSASVELPASADGEARVTDDTTQVSVGFTMMGARAVGMGTTREGIALYAGAGPGGSDVVHRVHAEGTEDYVVFEGKPEAEELRYEVDVSRVAGLRLVSNVLEFLDEGGAPRLRVAPPYVVGAGGVRSEAKLAVAGCAYDTDASGPWARAPTRPGAGRCEVRASWGGVRYPAVVDPSWVATGSMTVARCAHTATRLNSGNILVAGGSDGVAALSSAELFDGNSSFAATGPMTTVQGGHTATLLGSGKVLVCGGSDSNNTATSSAELFDGNSSFAATGPMSTARAGHTATLLGSGKVLIAGGQDAGFTELSTAELFDGNSTFAGTGSMTAARASHTATLLGSGDVLLAGGTTSGHPVASAELFDGSLSFAATGSMSTTRAYHTATLLGSGKVLVAGGDGNGAILSSAELFDGSSIFVATGSMTTVRAYQAATLLGSGRVLVAGGDDGFNILASAELFDGSSTFAATSPMITGSNLHTATLLASGKVLVAGGILHGLAALSSAELFALVGAGGTCSVDGDCSSTVCLDGICCAVACPNSGVCQVCVAGSGACQTVTNADDPDNCTGTMTCNATGACEAKTGQPSMDPTTCASGFASDGYCCNSACGGACDVCAALLGASADGTCTPAPAGQPGSPACGNGLACDGADVTCPASPCTSDIDCLPTDYCAANGSCTLQKMQGVACNLATDCRSAGACRECTAGCVDGVCCGTPTCPACQACAAALKQSGLGDGTCGPAKAGTNPHDDPCPTSPPTTCGPDGQCDGNSGCQTTYHVGTSCGMSICSNSGNLAEGQLCNGSGQCNPNAGVSCDPYVCASGSCPTKCTDDSQCIATAYCTAAHTCVPRQPKSAPCAAQDQCANGICIDGFCCDQACGGACEACDVKGAHGTCSAVAGAPHGSRVACTGMASGTCAGSCDGKHTAACSYPAATTSCGSACKGNTLTTSTCDGKGDCVAGSPTPCASELVCAEGGVSCKASCTSGSDCSQGYGCSGGKCTPVGAKCVDAQTSQGSGATGDAGVTTCAPYICDQGTGACLQMCTSTSDCVSPAMCTPSGQCVAPPSASNGSSGGCSTSPQGGTGSEALGLLGLALLGSGRRRARAGSADGQTARRNAEGEDDERTT